MTGRARRDVGMVTAELAVAIPVLVLVLALALSAVRLGIDRVRVVDAAHAAARLAARGESERAVRAAALRAAPQGTVVLVVPDGDAVRVTVEAPAPPMLSGLGVVPGARGSALARLEAAGGACG